MARLAQNPTVQKAYFKQLLKRYASSDLKGFRTGMAVYFTTLINEGSYDRAFELALEMIYNARVNKLEWKHKIKVARSFIEYDALTISGDHKTALQILNEINLNDHLSATSVGAAQKLFLLKAALGDLTNGTKEVYDTVLAKYTKLRLSSCELRC